MQRIIELCQAKGLKKPEVIESGLFVKYIFHRQQDAKQDAKSNALRYEAKIIEYLRINRELNISTAMKILNLSKSRTNSILKNMQQIGNIEKQGVSRATKYILKKR